MSSFRILCPAVLAVALASAQVDPGPRGGAAGAGSFFTTLSMSEQMQFSDAQSRFEQVNSVSGNIAGESGSGLGPTFNGNSCAMCHAQPAVGGTSPGLKSPQNSVPNPQVALAKLDGATNTVPWFIKNDGPVREARFVMATGQDNGTPDGGVHGLYTIQGRTDAVGCTLAQPDFATELANKNVIFRIPTPVFGLGLVENTPDATLQSNLASTQSQRAKLGIGGRFNTTGNDGTITRFGWKAQNKSLLIFAGEAYNVEMGVANELFPNERSAVPGCVFNSTPEDVTGGSEGESGADTTAFAIFMRLLAPPSPTTATSSEQRGQVLFGTIGCALCHSPSLTTAASPFTGMSNVTYQPFSDFALHHMGSKLADGISQGAAGPDEFRTAPLWGVGQRLYFLHDGRAADLLAAIEAHSSPGSDCVSSQSSLQFQANGDLFHPFSQATTCGSEANEVMKNFHALKTSEKQAILDFLRSL